MQLKLMPSLICAICLTMASSAHALTYNEGIGGDLSNNFSAPTVLGQLAVGSNTVTGTSSAGTTAFFATDSEGNPVPIFPDMDVDTWTITIAPNTQLDSIVLDAYSYTINTNVEFLLGPGVIGDGSWFAVQSGTAITDPNSPAALLGGGPGG
jgi:hypothetical protein